MTKKKPSKEQQPVIGYKGFDKDLKCNDYQYKIGENHKVDSMKLCNYGLHFCENPFAVFRYYPPANETPNRFALVQATDVSDEKGDDSKRVAKQLKVTAEIGLPGIIKAGVEYILSKVEDEKEDTGYQSAATNTGDRSAARVEGKESVAISLGIEGKASGDIGCWLVLAEWEQLEDGWHRKDLQSILVDGEKIKEDVYYMLCGGKVVEAEGDGNG